MHFSVDVDIRNPPPKHLLGNGIGAQQMRRIRQWIFLQYHERGTITWTGECLEAGRAVSLLLW